MYLLACSEKNPLATNVFDKKFIHRQSNYACVNDCACIKLINFRAISAFISTIECLEKQHENDGRECTCYTC